MKDSGYGIQVKGNAPEQLRRALSRAPVDIVATGDYQAAERRFGLSRRVFEVCLELGFPVSVLGRSPLVLRDLDLLKEINRWAPGFPGVQGVDGALQFPVQHLAVEEQEGAASLVLRGGGHVVCITR